MMFQEACKVISLISREACMMIESQVLVTSGTM